MEVVDAEKSDLGSFFAYLENQQSENGNGEVPLFQPMSKSATTLGQKSRKVTAMAGLSRS